MMAPFLLKPSRLLPIAIALSWICQSAAPARADLTTVHDLIYATANERPLALDLYLPNDPNVSPLRPVLLWIHGGAWRSGSKENPPILSLTKRGYAIASVDYRLTPVAPFPAQAHDIKAAIRFLRGHANDYHLDSKRFAIAGASAGGHLAALVGLTNGQPDLEGTLGNFLDESSSIQACVSLYGASNLTSILRQSTPHGIGVRIPALQLLLGGQPEDKEPLAKLASPVFHVDADDPPLFLIHGDQDPQMPINQSHELQGLYERFGLSCVFQVLHGAAHGGDAFYTEAQLDKIASFLKQSLP